MLKGIQNAIYQVKGQKNYQNPLLTNYPKNAKCFCGSGKYFKKCCRPKQPTAVTKKVHDQIMDLLVQRKVAIHKALNPDD